MLKRLHAAVVARTLRGKHILQAPLALVSCVSVSVCRCVGVSVSVCRCVCVCVCVCVSVSVRCERCAAREVERAEAQRTTQVGAERLGQSAEQRAAAVLRAH
eukprot:748063-Rhodomonas_salina.1